MCLSSAQSCLTLCNPMNYSLAGSSARGILQARILEWIAIPFSRGSSRPGNQTWISCIADRFFTTEPLGKPNSQATLGHFCWLMLVRSGDQNHAFRKSVLRIYDSISNKDSQNITSSPTVFHHSCSELAIYFESYIYLYKLANKFICFFLIICNGKNLDGTFWPIQYIHIYTSYTLP